VTRLTAAPFRGIRAAPARTFAAGPCAAPRAALWPDCGGLPPWQGLVLTLAVAATLWLSVQSGADAPFRLPRAGGRPVAVRVVGGRGGGPGRRD
jgi:hypothetical protein